MAELVARIFSAAMGNTYNSDNWQGGTYLDCNEVGGAYNFGGPDGISELLPFSVACLEIIYKDGAVGAGPVVIGLERICDGVIQYRAPLLCYSCPTEGNAIKLNLPPNLFHAPPNASGNGTPRPGMPPPWLTEACGFGCVAGAWPTQPPTDPDAEPPGICWDSLYVEDGSGLPYFIRLELAAEGDSADQNAPTFLVDGKPVDCTAAGSGTGGPGGEMDPDGPIPEGCLVISVEEFSTTPGATMACRCCTFLEQPGGPCPNPVTAPTAPPADPNPSETLIEVYDDCMLGWSWDGSAWVLDYNMPLGDQVEFVDNMDGTYTITVNGVATDFRTCCPTHMELPATLDCSDPVAVAAFLSTQTMQDPGSTISCVGNGTPENPDWVFSYADTTGDGEGDTWITVQAPPNCNDCSQYEIDPTDLAANPPPFPDQPAAGIGPGGSGPSYNWNFVTQMWEVDCCPDIIATNVCTCDGGVVTSTESYMYTNGDPLTDADDLFTFQIDGPSGTIFNATPAPVPFGTVVPLIINGNNYGTWTAGSGATFDLAAYAADEGLDASQVFLQVTRQDENGEVSNTATCTCSFSAGPPVLDLDGVDGDEDFATLNSTNGGSGTGLNNNSLDSTLRLYESDGATPLPPTCTGTITVTFDCGAAGLGTYVFPLNSPMNAGTLTTDDGAKPWASLDPYFSGSSSDGSVWSFDKQAWAYQQWHGGAGGTTLAPEIKITAQIDVQPACGTTVGQSNTDDVIMRCYTFYGGDNNFICDIAGGSATNATNYGVGGISSVSGNVPANNSESPSCRLNSPAGFEWYEWLGVLGSTNAISPPVPVTYIAAPGFPWFGTIVFGHGFTSNPNATAPGPIAPWTNEHGTDGYGSWIVYGPVLCDSDIPILGKARNPATGAEYEYTFVSSPGYSF